MRASHLVAAIFTLAGAPVLADPVLGTWQTEADNKGQVAMVRVTKCGTAFCGKITEVFDPSGNLITHPNVGKRVFWDMKPLGDGKYDGIAFVPAHNKQYPGQMRLMGDQLKVGGCVGPVCLNQVWRRVQ